MHKDLKLMRSNQKIVTKHEWMMGALDLLEKHDRSKYTHKPEEDEEMLIDEETP